MTDIPFYTKHDFVKLMRQKRGKDFTYGWLEMAYAMPSLSDEVEMKVLRKEMAILENLPDYDGV
jgi:hypothetical protein